MARRRRKVKRPTKLVATQRRLAAVEWSLVKAQETCAQLQGELTRVLDLYAPSKVSLRPGESVRSIDPPPHTDADAPPDLCGQEWGEAGPGYSDRYSCDRPKGHSGDHAENLVSHVVPQQHSATCAGCSWCKPELAAKFAPPEPAAP